MKTKLKLYEFKGNLISFVIWQHQHCIGNILAYNYNFLNKYLLYFYGEKYQQMQFGYF